MSRSGRRSTTRPNPPQRRNDNGNRSTNEPLEADDADAPPTDATSAANEPEAQEAAVEAWYGPLESITMRPRLFLLPILVLFLLALVAGFVRKPVYTATSQLIVGSVIRDYEVNQGQAQAVSDLTDIYSRLVGSPDHMSLVDDSIGSEVPPAALTAAPIPDSALLRIDATGSSQEQATQRADVAASTLVAYVNQLRTDSQAAGDQLLSAISDASAASAAAEAALSDAQQAEANATGAALEPARQRLAEAEAAATTAALRLDTLKSNYSATQAASSGGIALNVFSPAAAAGSDRKNELVIYCIGALLIGGIIGAGLATLSANNWKLLPPRREATVA